MDYFKETEELLYSVPKHERAIIQMQKRRDRLIKKAAPGTPTGVDYSAAYVKASFANDTFNDLCALADVCASIEQTQALVAEIKGCVEAIADAELKLCLQLWYFEKLPKERIAERLDRWSVSTIYTKRNLAVREFARLYWGAKIK